MSPIGHPYSDMFLLGFIAASSLVAGLFFLRFWKSTRDSLFLSFAAFFVVLGTTDTLFLALPRPNEGHLWLTLVRLSAVLLVLGSILRKNFARD